MSKVFIIGSKGIPAKYGGFETFVEKLTANRINNRIEYHVACLANNEDEFEHNQARCFNVKVSNLGSVKAVLYDLLSLSKCIKYIEEHNLNNSIIYVLACRIGPFLHWYKKKLVKNNIQLYVNPDGHEWKRSKWNKLIKAYWKFSEKLMVKYADLLICDSKVIEEYIKTEYRQYHPKTMYISYGADLVESRINNDSYLNWLNKHQVEMNKYYLIVGRFVPENNFETMIREFMTTKTNKNLIIITNVKKDKYYDYLISKTGFSNDSRVKFVGTVYDEELLKKIRENAFAYIHGHEVGGTNPSLLEALASTKLNILLDVSFNKEVGADSSEYFSKDTGSLGEVISKVETYSQLTINNYGIKAKQQIKSSYSWENIVAQYERLFIEGA